MAPTKDSSPLYSPDGLTRWYIDTRGLTASTSDLPLLETLQPVDQKTVQAYYHLSDKHMSLASYLLKYLFIHQTCRVPWSQITISRTPAPHKRPCYIPPPRPDDSGSVNQTPPPTIEFNVSHQASMVALAGCIAPPTPTSPTDGGPSPPSSHIGIDITCTTERERRNSQSIPKTEAELRAFIEIFSEVFSDREIQDMKSPSAPAPQSIHDRLRRFYTYWALKEAYIKLTGEALLAPWLRQLEFVDVVVPEPPMQMVDDDRPEFGAPYAGTRILLHGKELKDVRIEVVALGDEYIFATAAKGPGIGKPIVVDADEGSNTESPVDRWNPFRPIDIESDIGPCARAECRCLDSKVV